MLLEGIEMKKVRISIMLVFSILMGIIAVGCGADNDHSLSSMFRYDFNAGQVMYSSNDTELVDGDSITATAAANEGYHFVGWSKNNYLHKYGELVSEEKEHTFTIGDTRYYANFIAEDEALVCYYANGGTITVADAKNDCLIQKVKLGKHPYPMTLAENGTFVRAGYNLIEYADHADGSGVVTNIGQRAFVPNDRIIKLYAQWVKVSEESAFAFEQREDGYYVTGYSGEDAVLSVPAQYNNADVVGVASNAICSEKIKTVVLPHTVSCLEKSAFANCSALEKIYLYDAIGEMSDESFQSCAIKTVCLNSVYDKKYEAAGAGKLELVHAEQKSATNKMVVISGSSNTYALDSDLLQSSLKKEFKVINLSLQISVPNTFVMSILNPYLGEGDVVVLAPEIELKQYNNLITTFAFTLFDGAFTEIRNVDVRAYRSFFSALSTFSLAKQVDDTDLVDESQQFYTDNGDVANGRTSVDFPSDYSYVSPLSHYDMSENIYQRYNAAIDALKEKGVTCYLSFAPFCAEACQTTVTNEMLDQYSSAFGDKLHAIRISDQSSYNFPKKYFFEMFHMTGEGKEHRTKQLIEDLNAQFEKE